MRDNALTVALARAASLPFRLRSRHAFVPPRKALILKPCCLSQVLLATPLLAALSDTYPNAKFDWAVSDYARPAIIANERLSELVGSGRVGLPGASWSDVHALIAAIRVRQYDTAFIPSRSSVLAYVAWRAAIPQRVGLSTGGRGFAHTLVVGPPPGEQHAAAIYLSLARALGIDGPAHVEFYPSDRARTAMTALLVDEVDWLGETPLVLFHPGGGHNPWHEDATRLWPIGRFARLGNHLVRQHNARLLVVGDAGDQARAAEVAGLISAPVMNLAGRLGLAELGALAEMADLYVGNDAGPTHVAAAVGCPTLAIFGPTNPAVSGPFATKGHVLSLWRPSAAPFSWDTGVTAEEAAAAADLLLRRPFAAPGSPS